MSSLKTNQLTLLSPRHSAAVAVVFVSLQSPTFCVVILAAAAILRKFICFPLICFSCGARYMGTYCEYDNPCRPELGRCLHGGRCNIIVKDAGIDAECQCAIGKRRTRLICCENSHKKLNETTDKSNWKRPFCRHTLPRTHMRQQLTQTEQNCRVRFCSFSLSRAPL